ncbi:MAG: tetratricopeptide repeat protein [Kiritimatiellia bacterium]
MMDGHRFRHLFRVVICSLFLFVGFGGLLHSFSACRAQRTYLRNKYGFFRGMSLEVPKQMNADAAARDLRAVSSSYGSNYYFPAYVANLYLNELHSATNWAEYVAARDGALYFSREAVALNPYNDEARYTRLYALTAAERFPEAIAYWRTVLETEYWVPEYHNEYAKILLREGSSTNLMEAAKERSLVSDRNLRNRLQKMAKLFSLP